MAVVKPLPLLEARLIEEPSAGSRAPSDQAASLAQLYRDLIREPTSPRPPSDSAATFKEYNLDGSKVVGKGGDSVIVLATHAKHGSVALKITDKHGRKAEQIGRTRFEACFLTERISHPNIIKAYAWMESPEHIVMAMEYSSFGDLLDLLNLRKGFSESESCKIVRQLVAGLDAAHSMNIVHGDMKLENILLFRATPEEQERYGMRHRVCICDWGFSRPAGQLLVRSFGSIYYTAPEVVILVGELSPAADIWGLGVILFALFCGCLPFQDDLAAVLRENIAHARYAYPPGIVVSDHAKDLVAKLLTVDPRKRPTTKTILQHPWFHSALSTASPRKAAASQLTDAH